VIPAVIEELLNAVILAGVFGSPSAFLCPLIPILIIKTVIVILFTIVVIIAWVL
jgi:hypothetical protein